MPVVEVVHQGFGEIQDAHACADWALEKDFVPVHLNAGQVIAKDRCSCKQGACDKLSQLVSFVRPDKLNVDAVSEVFHRLADDGVDGVQGDVWLHPRPLLELEDFVDFP